MTNINGALFINGKFPVYSQTFVHDQIRAFKAHQNDVVSVFAKRRMLFQFSNSDHSCADGLIYAEPVDLRARARTAVGFLRNPRRGLKAIRLFRKKKISFETFMLMLQLRHMPALCITHFGNNYNIGMELKQYFLPNVKNIVVFHGADISSYVCKNGWTHYQRAAPYIDLAICVNRIWAHLLKENTKIADVRTIHLGTAVIPPRERLEKSSDECKILFVGRFVEKKGFSVLYEAISHLRDQQSRKVSLKVHCVGDGDLLDHFMQRAKADGLLDMFVFHGAQQKQFVLELMQSCDFMVAPSRTAANGDSEGIPVALMEAMMSGLPVISTFHSGIPELISDGETGLLVRENDVEHLRSAIDYAISHSDEMAILAEQAYRHVVEFHDEEKQIEKFISAVKEVK